MKKTHLLAVLACLAASLTGCAASPEPAAPSLMTQKQAQAVVAQLPVSAPTAQRQLSLAGYQESNGLVGTFKGGPVADPYFGLYSLELAHRAGLNTSTADRAFIAWGLEHQRADGSFDRYCKTAAQWRACGKTDSDDATLARWLQLLTRTTGKAMPAPMQASFDKAEAALFKLKMPIGTFSVFPPGTPGYAGYALFKDNVEVLNALEDLSRLFAAKGNSFQSSRYAQEAQSLRKAMATHFGADPFAMKAFALGARYDRIRFYPHQVAIPFGWMEGYFTAPSSAQWDRWLAQSRADWYANAEKDFPWGLMAVASVVTGPASEGAAWLAAHQNLRKNNERWNVLEEVSAQILEHKLRKQ